MRESSMVMARVLRGLVAAALMLGCLAGCSVDRRSGAYRCEDPSECSEGRVCQQGWCVVGSAPDAGPSCPAACTSCVAGRCVITCASAQDCPSRVVCPAGLDCDVTCTGNQRCTDGVDCSRAGDCTIVCEGVGACAAGVTCGSGACDVECSGVGACALGIDCSASCACDTECEDDVCAAPACPGDEGECERSGECSSAGCDFC
jgi:hypothetical protein